MEEQPHDGPVKWGASAHKRPEAYRIGQYTHVESGFSFGQYCVLDIGPTDIGKGTEIRNFVEIRDGTTIGKNCYIDSRVSFSGGGTTVGDNVRIRYGAILCKGITIEDGVFICPQVMTNNVQVDGSKKPGIVIKKNAFIGTQSVIEAGVTIGEGAIVYPCSYVNRDVPPGARVRGVPARMHQRDKTKEYYEEIERKKHEK